MPTRPPLIGRTCAPATPGLADPPAAAPAAPEASSLALEMPESALTLGPALPPAVAPSPLPPPAALDRQIVLKYVRQV